MKKVDDGEKKRKKKEKKEKNGVFSAHYVIASSLLPERGPLERRTLVPKDSLHIKKNLSFTVQYYLEISPSMQVSLPV